MKDYSYLLRDATPEQLDAFRAGVRKAMQHGSAVSFVQQEMRHNGWRRLGTLLEFEEALEFVGFTLQRTRAKTHGCTRRTDIIDTDRVSAT